MTVNVRIVTRVHADQAFNETESKSQKCYNQNLSSVYRLLGTWEKYNSRVGTGKESIANNKSLVYMFRYQNIMLLNIMQAHGL